MANIWATL